MKIICTKQNILNGLNLVSQAIPANTTMSILQCVLIQAGNGEIKLTANDMDLGVETVIDGIIDIAGTVAIDCRMLKDTVRKMPDDLEMEIASDMDFNVTIRCGSISLKLNGRSGDDFTYLPELDRQSPIDVNTLVFKDVINQTIFSIGNGEINKTMSGVDMVIKNDYMKITTLDGHRISIRKIQLDNIYEEQEVIIPGKALSDLSKIMPVDSEKMMSIYLSDAHIMFVFERTVVVSRLLDGKYYDVDKMMSSAYETKITINRKSFFDCVDRSLLFSKEGNKKPIVIGVNDEFMDISVNSPLGSMDEVLDIKKQGKDIKIGFNPKFIIDVLKVIDSDEIDIYMVNARSPLYIKDENEKYIYMILPVNLS